MTAVPSLLAPPPASALAVGKPAKPAASGFALILADTTPVDVAAPSATGIATVATIGITAPGPNSAGTQASDDVDPTLLVPAGQPEPDQVPVAPIAGATTTIAPPADRHDAAADGKPLPPADRMAALRARLLASATPAPAQPTDDDATPAADSSDDTDKDDKTTSSPPVVGIDATTVAPVAIVPSQIIPPVVATADVIQPVVPPSDTMPSSVAAAATKVDSTPSPPGPIAKALAGVPIASPAVVTPATPPPPPLTTAPSTPPAPQGRIVSGIAPQVLAGKDASIASPAFVTPATPPPPPLPTAPSTPPAPQGRIVSGIALQALAGGDAGLAPATGQAPMTVIPLPHDVAPAAKDEAPVRLPAVNGAPAAAAPAAPVALLAPAVSSTSAMPVGSTAPAGQAFAAAIEAADRQDRLAADRGIDASTAAAAPVAGTISVAAAGGAGTDQPSLDMRQQGWPAAMVDHIEKLRDAADATSTRIRVVPDALGSIDVTVHRHDDGGVQVSLAADRPATQAMIADARPELTRLAGERGTRLDVSVGTGTGGSAFGTGGGAPDGRAQPHAAPRRAPAPAPIPSDDPADAAEGRVA